MPRYGAKFAFKLPVNGSAVLRFMLLQVSGEVLYNGIHTDQFVLGRTAAYVDQTDNHIAELTVCCQS